MPVGWSEVAPAPFAEVVGPSTTSTPSFQSFNAFRILSKNSVKFSTCQLLSQLVSMRLIHTRSRGSAWPTLDPIELPPRATLLGRGVRNGPFAALTDQRLSRRHLEVTAMEETQTIVVRVFASNPIEVCILARTSSSWTAVAAPQTAELGVGDRIRCFRGASHLEFTVAAAAEADNDVTALNSTLVLADSELRATGHADLDELLGGIPAPPPASGLVTMRAPRRRTAAPLPSPKQQQQSRPPHDVVTSKQLVLNVATADSDRGGSQKLVLAVFCSFTVADVLRSIALSSATSDGARGGAPQGGAVTRARLIFRGQVLDPRASLSATGVRSGDTVHFHCAAAPALVDGDSSGSSTSTSTSGSGCGASWTCVICTESTTRPCDRAKLEPCAHSFCHGCIAQWSSISCECPVCRTAAVCLVTASGARIAIDPQTLHLEPSAGDDAAAAASLAGDGGGDISTWSGCEVCELSTSPSTLLLCDICDGAYHIACLQPPLPAVPEGNWFCPACDVGTDAGARNSDSDDSSDDGLFVPDERKPKKRRRRRGDGVEVSFFLMVKYN